VNISKLLFILVLLFSNSAFGQIKLIKDLNGNSSGVLTNSLASNYLYNDNLFITHHSSRELYTTVNTNEDIVPLPDSTSTPIRNPINFTNYEGKVYFTGFFADLGYTLIVSDGTSNGTYRLTDKYFSYIPSLVLDSDRLYFSGEADDNDNFYVFNITTNELIKVEDENNYDFESPGGYTRLNDYVYFLDRLSSISTKLWRFDPMSGEVELINDGWLTASILTTFNDQLVLKTKTLAFGVELFIGDGTPQGTSLLKNANPGDENSNPVLLFQTPNKLFFRLNDGTHGSELWTSDGTTQGTNLFYDFSPGEESGNPQAMTSINDNIYLLLRNSEIGRELHKLEDDGFSIVRNINESPSNSIGFDILTYKDALYFAANDGIHGHELWTSDGTFDGTYMVEDYEMVDPSFAFPSIIPVAAHDRGLYLIMRDESIGFELYYLEFEISSDNLANAEIKTFNVYPNPTNGNVNFSSKLEFDYAILHDTAGNIITKTQNRDILNNEIQSCNSGMYYILLFNSKGKNTSVAKFIKH